jgi:small-conductance mechanosensitive channel
MNPTPIPRISLIALLVLVLATMAGVAQARAPAPAPVHAATPTIAAIASAGLPDVLPGTDLHTRFQTALGQVEGKLVQLVAAAPLLLVAITIVLLAAWLGRVLSRRGPWLRLHSHNPYMEGLVRRIVQTFVLLAGVLVALDLLGATSLVGAVLGSAGVVGLVLGFAFKDIAENYVSGILLSLRRPFSPGDHVVIDTREGKVVALDSRATTLMTLDGSQLRLPNALVFKSVVLNYSVNPKRRFEFSMILDPGESIRRAQGLAMEVISGVEGVLADPAPSSLVQEYAPAGTTLRFFGWVDQRGSDLGKVRSEAIRQVKAAYGKAGVQAPRTISHVILSREPDTDERMAVHVEAGSGDTSVNRDIDQQLAAAQRASDDDNLLDGKKPSLDKP